MIITFKIYFEKFRRFMLSALKYHFTIVFIGSSEPIAIRLSELPNDPREFFFLKTEINEESSFCSAKLNYAPVAEDDEKWVSCEVRKSSKIIKSNNCFNLDVKRKLSFHFTSINHSVTIQTERAQLTLNCRRLF